LDPVWPGLIWLNFGLTWFDRGVAVQKATVVAGPGKSFFYVSFIVFFRVFLFRGGGAFLGASTGHRWEQALAPAVGRDFWLRSPPHADQFTRMGGTCKDQT
jgi:hypothetical protein